MDDYTAEGVKLTNEILAAVVPMLNGRPSQLVLEALAGAMMAAVVVACPTAGGRREFLARYADCILTFADTAAEAIYGVD
jgi:hypothetical protein